MADPRVCSSKAHIELADVVRQFGPQYTSQYGNRMMPWQQRALSDIAACCTPELGGRLYRCNGLVNLFVSARVGTKLARSGPSWGRQSVLEHDGEVVQRFSPLRDRHGPLLGRLVDG